jgi:tetratricopeptide (TPR) repeat protein
MKQKNYILSIILFFSINCIAQTIKKDEFDFPDFGKIAIDSSKYTPTSVDSSFYKAGFLLDSSLKSLCLRDTLKAVEFLKTYLTKYHDSGIDRLVRIRLGQIYRQLHQYELAESVLLSVLNNDTNKGYFYITPKEIGNCEPLLKTSEYVKAKSLSCIELYKVSMLKQEYSKANEYLVRASTKYFPYMSCGNEADMYELYITQYFLEYYLFLGDTTKVINKALDNILNEDGSKLSKDNVIILKKLLQTRYSEKEIREAITKEIQAISKTRYFDKEIEKTEIHFYLFGHKIEKINKYSFSNTEDIKKYLM